MMALARTHVWWPGLDKELEMLVKACQACQAVKDNPPKAPLHTWAWPTASWQRIHIDFAGSVMEKMLLVAVDVHSKWSEVLVMNTTTASKTITALKELFAQHGLPEQVVSNNGPRFTSSEFSHFLAANEVKHLHCAPYHPASNGAVERLVQTVKRAIKSGQRHGVELDRILANFLLQYRATPQATTGTTPSSPFLEHSLRTRLDLL